MTDMVSPEKRSRMMAGIQGINNATEVYLGRLLFARGLRYRKYVSSLPGKPDFYLAKYKAVIFMNGCFWHAHEGCKYYRLPHSNVDFWEKKLSNNVERDKRTKAQLEEKGIRIIIVWECAIRQMRKDEVYREDMLDRIIAFLKGEETFLQIDYGVQKQSDD